MPNLALIETKRFSVQRAALAAAPQRHNTENFKQIFPEKELRGLSPNFHIHVSVSDLYIPTIGLPILLQENIWTDHGNKLFIDTCMWKLGLQGPAIPFLGLHKRDFYCSVGWGSGGWS